MVEQNVAKKAKTFKPEFDSLTPHKYIFKLCFPNHFMPKKRDKEVVESMRELNKSMLIEIFVLIYFILSLFLKIFLYITIPIAILILIYEEYKINKIKKEMGFDRGGETSRILGIIICLTGFALLISSPLFKELIMKLILPITIITVGAFVLLISKFYDSPKGR